MEHIKKLIGSVLKDVDCRFNEITLFFENGELSLVAAGYDGTKLEYKLRFIETFNGEIDS